jgi:hypothetical protein
MFGKGILVGGVIDMNDRDAEAKTQSHEDAQEEPRNC